MLYDFMMLYGERGMNGTLSLLIKGLKRKCLAVDTHTPILKVKYMANVDKISLFFFIEILLSWSPYFTTFSAFVA